MTQARPNSPNSTSGSGPGEDLRSTIQRWRVPLGFISAILYVVFSRPTWRLLVTGLPLAVAGSLVRAWASGHLRKNRELATGGPYAFTRNPLYFGSFLLLLGFAIAGGSLPLGLWLILFFWLIYWPVIRAEAAHVEELFGEEYLAWAREVPLFFPRLTPAGGWVRQNGERSFDLQQYLNHREYRLTIGLLFVILILIAKIVWG
ncbi:MAG: methyltransferase family protein [Acidobacteriota bacterium]